MIQNLRSRVPQQQVGMLSGPAAADADAVFAEKDQVVSTSTCTGTDTHTSTGTIAVAVAVTVTITTANTIADTMPAANTIKIAITSPDDRSRSLALPLIIDPDPYDFS